MNNINEEIPYRWLYGWEGVPEEAPRMTLLLKAILERNVEEMDSLWNQGARLKGSDNTTFRRVLFHVVDSYPVMKWLVEHGVSRIGLDIDAKGDNGINMLICYSQSGHMWGVAGRAYYLGAYDVFELLCAHGFDDFKCYNEGWGTEWDADEQIFRSSDEDGLRILLENGYIFSDCNFYMKAFKNYVLNRKQVKRKTVGLDYAKFYEKIPETYYESFDFIRNDKLTEKEIKRLKEDYADRARAHAEFIKQYDENQLLKYRERTEKQIEHDKEIGEQVAEAMNAIMDDIDCGEECL